MEVETPGTSLVLAPHPLMNHDRKVMLAEYVPGENITQYLERMDALPTFPCVLCLNDRMIPIQEWDDWYPRPGEVIILRAVATGGDGGNNQSSDPLRILAFIAVAVLTVWTGVTATAAWGPYWGALAGAAVSVGGALLINTLLPPPRRDYDNQDDNTPTYSITGGSNQARPFGVLPLVVGTHRMFPDLGSIPFTELQGKDQYLYQIFNFGLGNYDISDEKIANTPLTTFQGVNLEYSVGDTGRITSIPGNIDTIAGGALPNQVWVERTTSAHTSRIGVDIEGLMYRVVRPDGFIGGHRVNLQLQYKVASSGTWLNWYNGDIWNGSRIPYRNSFYLNVAEDQYDVRAKVNDYVQYNDDQGSSDLSFTQLRSYQPDDGDYTGQKKAGLIIKASGQLQGVVDRFSVLVEAKCQVHETTPSVNSLVNPGFENSGSDFSPWFINSSGTYHTAAVDGVTVQAGSYSVALTVTATGGPETTWLEYYSIIQDILASSSSSLDFRAGGLVSAYVQAPIGRTLSGCVYRVFKEVDPATGSGYFELTTATDVTATGGWDLVQFTLPRYEGILTPDYVSIRFGARPTGLVISDVIYVDTAFFGWEWKEDTINSNPAWWYRCFARGKVDSTGRELFGALLHDGQLDIANLIEWGEWCDTKNLSCNFVIDRPFVAQDILSIISRCGRAIPTWANGKLGVVYDQANLPVTQMFGMSNIRAGTFSVQYITERLTEEIVAQFVNPDLDWQSDYVRVKVPNGAVSPQRTVNVELFGVTNEAQAGSLANLLAAQQYFFRKIISWETDLEYLVCNRGDVVSLSHDMTQWGYSGRLQVGTVYDKVYVDRKVSFTNPPAPSPGDPNPNPVVNYMMIRYPNGNFNTYAVATTGNIIANSGFETGDLTGWTLNNPGVYETTVVQTVTVLFGVYSVQMTVDALGGSPNFHNYALHATQSTINNGPFNASVSIKGPVGRKVGIRIIRVVNGTPQFGGGSAADVTTSAILADTEWTDFNVELDEWVGTDDTTSIEIRIGFVDLTAMQIGDIIYMDNVYVSAYTTQERLDNAVDVVFLEDYLPDTETHPAPYLRTTGSLSTNMNGAALGTLGTGSGALPSGWVESEIDTDNHSITDFGYDEQLGLHYIEFEFNGITTAANEFIKFHPGCASADVTNHIQLAAGEYAHGRVGFQYISGSHLNVNAPFFGARIVRFDDPCTDVPGSNTYDSVIEDGSIEWLEVTTGPAVDTDWVAFSFIIGGTGPAKEYTNYRFRLYAPQHEKGQFFTKLIINPTTQIYSESNAPDYLVFFDARATPGKKVKITDIKPFDLNRAKITAREEIDEYYLYEDEDYEHVIPTIDNSGLPIGSNLRIDSQLVKSGDTFATEVIASWTVSGNYGRAVLEVAYDGEDYNILGTSSTSSYRWIATQSVSLNLRVTFYNEDGLYGSQLELTDQTIEGKETPPPTPTVFTVTRQSDGTREFKWELLASRTPADLEGFLIRGKVGTGYTWDQLDELHVGVLKTSPWETNQLPAGSYTFAIKSIDTSGNESVDALFIESSLGDPRIPTALLIDNFWDNNWPGTRNNCHTIGCPCRKDLIPDSLKDWDYLRSTGTIISGTDFVFTATANTITTTTTVMDYRFRTGATFTVAGTTSNNGVYTVASKESDYGITVNEALTTESPAGTVTLAESKVSEYDISATAATKTIASTTTDLRTFVNGEKITIRDYKRETLNGTDIGFTAPDTIYSTVTDLSVFVDGDNIVVSGSGSNDGDYIITGTPTATTITLEQQTIVTEAPGATVTIFTDPDAIFTVNGTPTANALVVTEDIRDFSSGSLVQIDSRVTWDDWSFWPIEFVPEFSYVHTTIDLGAVLRFTPITTVNITNGNPTVTYRFKDNVIDPWVVPPGWVTGDPIEARYIEVTITVQPLDPLADCRITNAYFIASAQTIVDEIEDLNTLPLAPDNVSNTDISFIAWDKIDSTTTDLSVFNDAEFVTVTGSTGGTNDGRFAVESATATRINVVDQRHSIQSSVTTFTSGDNLITIVTGTFDSFWRVGDKIYTYGSVSNDGVYTIAEVTTKTIRVLEPVVDETTAGNIPIWVRTTDNSTSISFDGNTITFSGTAGAVDFRIFRNGDRIDVNFSTSNDGIYTVSGTPTASTLVVEETFTTETAGANIAIRAQTITTQAASPQITIRENGGGIVLPLTKTYGLITSVQLAFQSISATDMPVSFTVDNKDISGPLIRMYRDVSGTPALFYPTIDAIVRGV